MAFGSKFVSGIKTGLSRGFQIVKKTPEYISKALDFLEKVEKGIDRTKKIAGTIETGYNATKKEFPKAQSDKVEKGFKQVNDKLEQAKKIDDSLKSIGNTILSSAKMVS